MLLAMRKGMFLIVLMLAGCGSEPTDRTAGGVTPDEARALDDAAAMVEARRLPAEALRPPAGPAAPASAASGTKQGAASPHSTQSGQTGETKQ